MTWHREAAECQAASEHQRGGQLRSCLSPGAALPPPPRHTALSPPTAAVLQSATQGPRSFAASGSGSRL